jgi:hypothetical protein
VSGVFEEITRLPPSGQNTVTRPEPLPLRRTPNRHEAIGWPK